MAKEKAKQSKDTSKADKQDAGSVESPKKPAVARARKQQGNGGSAATATKTFSVNSLSSNRMALLVLLSIPILIFASISAKKVHSFIFSGAGVSTTAAATTTSTAAATTTTIGALPVPASVKKGAVITSFVILGVLVALAAFLLVRSTSRRYSNFLRSKRDWLLLQFILIGGAVAWLMLHYQSLTPEVWESEYSIISVVLNLIFAVEMVFLANWFQFGVLGAGSISAPTWTRSFYHTFLAFVAITFALFLIVQLETYNANAVRFGFYLAIFLPCLFMLTQITALIAAWRTGFSTLVHTFSMTLFASSLLLYCNMDFLASKMVVTEANSASA